MAFVAPATSGDLASTSRGASLDSLLMDWRERIERLVEAAAAEERGRARAQLSEEFNQVARRLRQAEDFDRTAASLADGAVRFCRRIVVFALRDGWLAASAWRGFASETLQDDLDTLQIALAGAGAFAGAVESGDPIVALSTPSQVSPLLAELLHPEAAEKVHLFPIPCGEETIGILYAMGDVDVPALELLCALAGQASRPVPKGPEAHPAVPLVNIAGVTRTKLLPEWTQLPPKEQQLHLRAQRTARVQVSKMRLYKPDAVRHGLALRDLYSALRREIDAAREEFRRDYLSACGSMVDYLHLELVRNLANNDKNMLGPQYPGSLV
ncbi:MAG: hypothetical protein WD696_09410 [Bryobacteraceae bacterium]